MYGFLYVYTSFRRELLCACCYFVRAGRRASERAYHSFTDWTTPFWSAGWHLHSMESDARGRERERRTCGIRLYNDYYLFSSAWSKRSVPSCVLLLSWRRHPRSHRLMAGQLSPRRRRLSGPGSTRGILKQVCRNRSARLRSRDSQVKFSLVYESPIVPSLSYLTSLALEISFPNHETPIHSIHIF